MGNGKMGKWENGKMRKWENRKRRGFNFTYIVEYPTVERVVKETSSKTFSYLFHILISIDIKNLNFNIFALFLFWQLNQSVCSFLLPFLKNNMRWEDEMRRRIKWDKENGEENEMRRRIRWDKENAEEDEMRKIRWGESDEEENEMRKWDEKNKIGWV